MRRVLTLTIVALMVATAFSASAFTTGYVDRTGSIDVVADGNGLIQLDDGTSGDLVGISNDELKINFANGSATGANTNASFTLGDSADANNASAFNISSNAGEAKDLTLNYTLDNADPDASNDNVNFTVYDSTGTELVSATESTDSATYSLGATETVYVVITVDTANVATSEVLDGTLRIKLA